MLDVMHLLAAEPAKPVDQKGVSTSGHVQYNNKNTFAKLNQCKVCVDSRCYHWLHWFSFIFSKSCHTTHVQTDTM